MMPMQQPTLIRYLPFKISLISTALSTVLWLIFLIVAINSCIGDLTQCISRSDGRIVICTTGSHYYCCSYYTSSYSVCGGYKDCVEVNSSTSSCSTFATLSWVFGSLMFVGLVCMIVFLCIFKNNKQNGLLANAAYQNINNPVYNQGYQNSNPVVYSN